MKNNKLQFDSLHLYEIYSKSNKRFIFEAESVDTSIKTDKFKSIIYYDKELSHGLRRFIVDFNFNIIFDITKIKEDYSHQFTVNNNDSDSVAASDADIEKMISNKIKGTQSQPVVKKEVSVDLESFYFDVLKRRFNDYSVSNKINDYILAGTINVGPFKIESVTYSVQAHDKLLLDKIELFIKKNLQKTTPLKYGFQLGVESSDITRTYSKQDLQNFVITFGEGFSNTVLKDTEYYTIKA